MYIRYMYINSTSVYLIYIFIFSLFIIYLFTHYYIIYFLYIGTLIPSQQLWAGNPAVYVRDVTEDEMSGFIKVPGVKSGFLL